MNHETIAFINRNFVIRYQYPDRKRTFLIGAGQYFKLVGEKTAEKHFKRVLASSEYKTTIKVRSSLKIIFHSK